MLAAVRRRLCLYLSYILYANNVLGDGGRRSPYYLHWNSIEWAVFVSSASYRFALFGVWYVLVFFLISWDFRHFSLHLLCRWWWKRCDMLSLFCRLHQAGFQNDEQMAGLIKFYFSRLWRLLSVSTCLYTVSGKRDQGPEVNRDDRVTPDSRF